MCYLLGSSRNCCFRGPEAAAGRPHFLSGALTPYQAHVKGRANRRSNKSLFDGKHTKKCRFCAWKADGVRGLINLCNRKRISCSVLRTKTLEMTSVSNKMVLASLLLERLCYTTPKLPCSYFFSSFLDITRADLCETLRT